MSEPTKSSTEKLLAHTAWVREIARRLVADPNVADDVAQDAVALALERPPDEGRLRSWLAVVVRNLVRQSRRSSVRRRTREERAARDEVEPSTLEVVQRVASHRKVVEAVTELDEPYRTVLLLRYFDGLTPREIAELLDLPVKTVKTRLSRGLERLRGQLSDAEGGEREWLLALLPLLTPPRAQNIGLVATGTLGAVIVDAKLKLSLSALAVAGALSGLYFLRDDSSRPEAPVDSVVAAAPAALERPAATLEQEPVAPVERVVIAPEVEPETAESRTPEPVATPVTFLVDARVLDVDAQPVGGIELAVEIAGAHDVLRDSGGVPLRTTPDGMMRFEATEKRGRLAVASDTWVTVLAGMLRSTSAITPTVVIAPEIGIGGRVVDVDGVPVAGAAVALRQPESFDARFPDALEGSQWMGWTSHTDAEGRYALDSAPRIADARIIVTAEGYERGSVLAPGATTSAADVVLVPHRAKEGGLAGQVVDPAGEGVADVRIAMGAYSTVSDEHGLFSVDFALAVGTRVLTAVKAGYLPAVETEPAAFGDAATGWPDFIRLELGGPPLAISGRVIDFDGNPKEGALVWIDDPTSFGFLGGQPVKVENLLAGADLPRGQGPPPDALARVVREGGNWDDMSMQEQPNAVWSWVETDANGRFRLPGLVPRAYRLAALDPDSLLIAKTGPIDAGTESAKIELARDALAKTVAGRVVSTAGTPLPDVRVRLIAVPFADQVALEEATFDTYRLRPGPATTTDGEGHFEFENVPKSGVWLSLRGDSILPTRYTPTKDDDLGELELSATAKCHVEVILKDPSAADAIAFVDEDGENQAIFVIRGGSIEVTTGMTLSGGKSGVIAISEEAVRLRLFTADGEVVLEVPIDTVPGEVTRIDL